MKVTLKISGLDDILNDELKKFNKKSVEVGYLNDDHLNFIAKIQEYGAIITVTPKMRNFLGMQYGVWLSPQKTHIVIPPRSFMLAAFANNKHEYAERFMKFYAVSGDVDDALDKLGQTIQHVDIPKSIDEHYVKWEKNSDMTILLKGYNRPLVNSGSLRMDVDRKVNS